MKTAQDKSKEVVTFYERVFAPEFDLFTQSMKVKQDLQTNRFASLEGEHVLEQFVLEKPETLHNLLKSRMTDDEWKYLESKPGVRWFAKTFPQYKIAEKL